MSGNHCFG